VNWSDIPRNPNGRTLRQFGLLCLLVFGGMAAWRYFGRHQPMTGIVLALAGAGAAGGLLGAVAPRALRPIFVRWMIIAFPIGWLVSRIILGLAFFLVFAPVGFLMRLSGRDPLALRRRDAASFWTEKRQPSDRRRYLSQY